MVAKQNCHNLDLDSFDLEGSFHSTLYSSTALIRYSLSCFIYTKQVTCQTPWALYGQASRAISIG